MNQLDLVELGARAAQFFLPFLFALCFHEFAHGWVARLKGDRTAELMGRLTLNPVAHADLFGTIIFPLVMILSAGGLTLFGWAKPVPVNTRNLKNPRVDMFWISLAGPLSNLILAIIGSVAFALVPVLGDGNPSVARFGEAFLGPFIVINMLLAVFNMIPIHPLDGGKVLALFLPESLNTKLEELQSYSFVILMLLMISGVLGVIVFGPAMAGAELLVSIAKEFIGG